MTPPLLTRGVLSVGAIMMAVLAGTALVSPLYPLYGQSWQLSTTQITLIYVYYMVGAVAGLLVLGRVADRWGGKRTLAVSLTVAFLGTALSAIAEGAFFLNLGRFLVGVANSLVTTGGVVSLLAMVPERYRTKLPIISGLFVSIGFAAGPLVGGIAGQWSQIPLLAAYVPVLIALLLCGLALIFYVPDSGRARPMTPSDFLPKLSWTGPGLRLRFFLTCCAPFINFGVFGLNASLMPSMVGTMTGFSGPIVTGLALCAFMTCSTFVQFIGRDLSPRTNILIGLTLSFFSSLGMLLNLSLSTWWWFGIVCLVAASGHALAVLGSTAALNQMSDSTNRGALTATYWTIGYSGAIFPLLLVSWMADLWGMNYAVGLFLCALAAMAALLTAAFVIVGRKD